MKTRFFRIISLAVTLTMLMAPFAVSAGAGPVRPPVAPSSDAPTSDVLPAWAGPSGPLTPLVALPVKHDVSRPMREMAPIPPAEDVGGREIPFLPLPKAQRGGNAPAVSDPAVVQNWLGPDVIPAPIANFDGVDNQTTVAPPDTEGDIGYDPATGTKYYFQWVNLWYAIWDVTDPASPTKVYPVGPGFANGNTPWQGFGGYCANTNDGDPIVLFDPLAKRWFMSQFALPNYPNGPFGVCIAVSQTADPTGAWYRYAYDWVDEFGGDVMNDYPKFGVWPDAYYMTVNQFYGSSPNCSGTWCGAGVAAFERDQMLLGNPAAQMVAFDLAGANIDFGGQLPADLDGLNPPPPGAPGYFFEWDDATWLGDPSDSVRVWEFDVDWATPANSTFGINGQPNLVIPTSDVNPNASNVPQPGTGQTLDVIADRLMYRAAYRNFGSYEALVTNRTNTSGGVAAPYWFELRRSGGGPWTLYQEGVYAPGDGDHRWMGSIAQDHVGNMALGYSVSSGSTYPSVRYTGRLVGDPLGTMPQGEAELVAGAGSQTGASNSDRWGDYSMMGIDPVDDCTFWYTQEYYPTTSGNHWYTRIGAFKFPNCSVGPTGVLSGTITDNSTSNPIVGAAIQAAGLVLAHTGSTTSGAGGVYSVMLPTDTYTVTVLAYGYISNTVSGVDIFSGTTTILDVALDPATMYVVEGIVSDTLTGWPLYASIEIAPEGFPGTTIWNDPVTGYYSVTLPAGITHTLTANAWVPGYDAASHDVGPLTADVTEDFALAADASCTAPGREVVYASIFTDDFESGYAGWSMTGPWNPESEADTCGSSVAPFPSSSNAAYFGVDGVCTYDTGSTVTGTLTMSSSVSVPASGDYDLYFGSYEETECGGDCGWDNRYVEISTDGGGMWTALGEGDTEGAWYQKAFDLSPYAGSNALFRFRFDSVDDFDNNYFGWMVDDILIAEASCELQPGGLVVGNVYDDNTGNPLLGAEVSNEDGYAYTTVTTPDDPAVEDGFYTLFSPPGSKTFTATVYNYEPDAVAVTVVQSDTVRQDFYLPAGELGYIPLNLQTAITLGLTTTLQLTLTNSGGSLLEFELVEGDRGFVPLGPARFVNVTIPGAEVTHGPDAKVKKRKSTYRPEINFTVEQVMAPAIAIEVLLLTPDTDTNLIETTLAAFGDLNVTKWSGGVDPTVGDLLPYEVVIVGNNFLWSGGGMTQAGVGDALADYIDAGGRVVDTLFVHDYAGWNLQGRYIDEGYAPFTQSTTDIAPPGNLGTVYDPSHPIMDGVTTITDTPTIGITHQDVGLASGATRLADWDDGEIFIAYNDDVVGINQLWYQGSSWSGDVPQLMHNAILYSASADVDWLAEDPISGTLGIGGQVVVDVNFDAGAPSVAQPGSYRAMLNVRNDAPYGQPGIPVTMTVTAPAGWGTLEGVVESLGYCDVNTDTLEGAEVFIEGTTGATWTVTTDISGTYSYWLDEAESPMTVTVTYPEHEVGLATGVLITGQMTTTVDLDLRWLVPCVDVTADVFSITQDLGVSTTFQVSVTNTGAGNLNFEFREQDGGFQLALRKVAGRGEWVYRAEKGTSMLTNQGEGALVYPSAHHWQPVRMSPSAPSVLIYADDFVHTAPNTYLDQALQTLGLAYTAHYDGDFVGFETDLTTGGPWDLVLFGNDNIEPPASTWTALDDYVNAGGKLVIHTWRVGSDPGNALWTTLGVIFVSNVTTGDDVYWWDPGHVMFDGVPEFVGLVAAGGVQGQRVEPLAGFEALAGYTTPGPDSNEAGLILGNDGSTVFRGFLDAGNDLNNDGDATLDGVELWVNLVEGIQVGFGGDVPWLYENPITGTLPADIGFIVADVTLDANYVSQPGVHYATLNLSSDDPVSGSISYPVTMTVPVPATYGKLDGTASSLGHCDANPAPLKDAEVFIGGTTGATWTVTTDISGTYSYWLDQGGYTVTVSHADHLSDTATVSVSPGMTITRDFSLRSLQPCVSAAPLSMEATVVLGSSEVQTLTLTNDGAGASSFQIREDEMNILYDNTHGGDPTTYDELMADMAAAGAVVDIVSTGPISAALLADYDIYWVPDNTSVTWTTAELDNIEAWVNGGGGLFANYDCCDDTTVPTLTARFDINYVGAGGTGGVTTDTYPHPTTVGVISINLPSPFQSITVTGAAEVIVNDVGGDPQVAANEPGGGRVVVVADDAFNDGTYATYDNALFAGNIFDWLAGSLDVPWLSEDPITGTVGVDNFFDVSITFTALPTMTEGIYTATLVANTDDAVSPAINIPVTMTVVALPVCGFTSSSPDDLGQTTYFTNTSSGALTYRWDFGDDSPISAAEHPTHTYAQAGWYTVVLTATNATGSSVCSDQVAIEGPPSADWQKDVYINNALTDTFPATVIPGDEIEIVDRVEIRSTENVTFTLTEEWTESLALLNYGVRTFGGTVVIPGYGSVLFPVTGTLEVVISNAPSDWGYVITKTFDVLAGSWTTDTITETLWVERAVPQPADRHLTFVHKTMVCTDVTGVGLVYTNTGTIYTDTVVYFSADITPDDAGTPYSYIIDYSDGISVTANSSADPLALSHTFAATGTYEVEIAVWNCDMTEPVTTTVEVVVSEYGACIGLTDITIGGDSSGTSGTYTFTTSYLPLHASIPISYTWDNGDTTATSVRTLSVDTHVLMVTATNSCMAGLVVTDTHQIVITGGYDIYLPLVLRNL